MPLHVRLLDWLRRRWPLVLASIALLLLVVLQFDEIKELGSTLAASLWYWVLVAAGAQIVYYALYAVLYQRGFCTVGVRSSVRQVVPPMLASLFAKMVVPSGAAAVPLFAGEVLAPGQSVALLTEGVLLVLAADLLTTLPLLALALLYLSSEGVLEGYQVAISALFVLVSLALTGLIYLGRWRPGLLYRFLAWTQGAANRLARLARVPPLPPRWAEEGTVQYAEAARSITTARRRHLARALEAATLAHIVEVASLYPVGLAVRQPLSVGALTAALAMDAVFTVINVVPHGLGVAEGVIALVLASLGVGVEQALAIAIVFRGLNVWLPVLVGFFFLRQIRSLRGRRS